jgi:hypothetical protein
MLREMRPSELGQWIALWRTDPWGEQRADLRQAFTSHLVAAGTLKKSSGKWELADFMPYAVKPEKTELDVLRERFGARVQRKVE